MQSQGDSSQLRSVQMLHKLTALHNAYRVGLVTALGLLTAIIRPFIIRTDISLFDNIRHQIIQIYVQNINNYAA